MSIWMKRVMWMAVLVMLGLGLTRAARFKFQDKEQAIRQACRDELQKKGLTRDAAKATYFTPEIHMASSSCVQPGTTSEVVIRGKFAPGTKFIFENDNIEVVSENLTAGIYRATVKVPAGLGPQTSAVTAITPLTCLSVRQDRVVVVGGSYVWTMNAANGWKIVARSTNPKACADKSSSGSPYDISFYRQGEATPFQKRTAELIFSLYDSSNFQFSIGQQDPNDQSVMGQYTALMKKLSDPSLSEEKRMKMMEGLEKMQDQLTAEMQKMADPAYIKAQDAKRLEFGCERISLAVTGANFTGQMRCSEKVGTRIGITGTLQTLGQ